jgi:hypothetical protein
MSADTRFVQGASGVIIQMDVPPKGHPREVHDSMLARGERSYVDPSNVEEYTTRGGGKAWRLKYEPTSHWAAEDADDLEVLDKDQLIAVADVRGVEIDRRSSKEKLIKAIEEADGG